MKKTILILTALGSMSLFACSDYDLLGMGSGNDGSVGPMTAAQLAGSTCDDAITPEGGVVEIFANMSPEAYSSGPLRLQVRLGIASGIDAAETDIGFFVDYVAPGTEAAEHLDLTNEVDWQISEDGTAAGADLCAPDGLEAGVYEFAAYVTGLLEWEGAMHEVAADTGVRYEATGEDGGDGEGDGAGEEPPPDGGDGTPPDGGDEPPPDGGDGGGDGGGDAPPDGGADLPV